jgi:hypothetical protein
VKLAENTGHNHAAIPSPEDIENVEAMETVACLGEPRALLISSRTAPTISSSYTFF